MPAARARDRPGASGSVGDHHGNLGPQPARGNGVDERLQVRTAARDEDAETTVGGHRRRQAYETAPSPRTIEPITTGNSRRV